MNGYVPSTAEHSSSTWTFYSIDFFFESTGKKNENEKSNNNNNNIFENWMIYG